MKQLAIKAENISKQYRLGQVGTGTISHDLNRFWHRVRGKEDPYLKIGDANDRTSKGGSDYVWSLRDINFEIEKGDAVGIIGRNGAGKSTLLKLLSKVTKPTTGNFKVSGRIASLLEVGTGFNPEMTGRENIYLNGAILGMRRQEITRKLDEIIDFSGVERYIDTPVKRYSSGMYVRLAFAVAAHLESEILIIDEVLAVGDAEFQKKCLGKMGDVSKNQGRTVLFVSHNMGAIQSLCNTAIYLKNGEFVAMGNAKAIVGGYLGEKNNLSNYKEYDSILKYVKIVQEKDFIILTAAYDLAAPILTPSLGFVLYNNEGIPIFGTNPIMENIEFNSRSYTSGTIEVKITEPKLIDGDYILSVWFGDGKENFLEDLECLTFEVSGMTSNKLYSQSIVGNIVPKTEWKFS